MFLWKVCFLFVFFSFISSEHEQKPKLVVLRQNKDKSWWLISSLLYLQYSNKDQRQTGESGRTQVSRASNGTSIISSKCLDPHYRASQSLCICQAYFSIKPNILQGRHLNSCGIENCISHQGEATLQLSWTSKIVQNLKCVTDFFVWVKGTIFWLKRGLILYLDLSYLICQIFQKLSASIFFSLIQEFF